MPIDFATDPTSGLTQTQIENVFENLREKSPLFDFMVRYVEQKANVIIAVPDSPSAPASEAVHSDPGYPGYDWVVYIPKQAFDGDTYNSGADKWTLERLMAHEVTHVLQGLSDDSPSTQAGLEEQARAYSDAIMLQAYPGDNPQGHYYNIEGDDTSGVNTGGGSGDSPHALDTSTPAGFSPFTLPDPVTGALTPWVTAPTEASPLVIDLSSGHTGVTLTTFDSATTTTFFDIEGTGFATQTAWTSGDTGLLVDDLNSNGKIDDVSEMFGSPTVDGFAKLATLDSNGDLKIDSHDADWSSLQVWVDSNGDGVTQSGELHSLSSLNIASIDLAGVAPSTDAIDGNAISHTSTVTFTSGDTAAIDDAWFVHDGVNSFYNGDYTLDTDTLFLPDLRGYGTVADLTIAMSQDSTLKGMVSDYVTAFGTDGFAQSTLDSDAANILYQWAGVDGVSSSSRGPNVDAQHLEFLEHLFDQAFVQAVSGSTNPDVNAGADIEQSWGLTLETFKDAILLQADASNLFTNPVIYDPWSGTISGDLSLSHTAITALDTNAPSPGSSNLAYWENVAHFLDNVKGLDSLSSDENTWMNSAVHTSDSSLTWDDVKNDLSSDVPGSTYTGTSGDDPLTGSSGDDTINGNGGNDTINAGDGNDTINLGTSGNCVVHGGYGNDTINTQAGNNTLYGDYGNDIIYGGTGTDTIEGGPGANFLHANSNDTTFVFGGGDEVIYSGGSGDQIVLPSGIDVGDLTFTRVSSDGSTTQFNDLMITVASGGSIEIVDHFVGISYYEVGTLVFSDSSTVDLTAITGYTTMLTSGDDSYSPGLDIDQVVHGMAGNDVIVTGNGNDVLDGGIGNDTLEGGGGNNTYIASPGFDIIEENGAGGTDTINIQAGFTSDDVAFSRHIGTSGPDNDLIINIHGLGEIQVENQFYSSDYAIEYLHFLGDSSTLTLADQTIQTIGTSGNDTLYGITSDVAGNWFDGRGGNDSFVGGIGNNMFTISSGFGNDMVSETSTSGTNAINFLGVDPANVRMWTDVYGSLYLQDTTDPSHSITVGADVTGSGTAESAVGQYLSQIAFDDTGHTTWDITGGLSLRGDNSGDSLYGTAYADTITGGSGVDTIYGNGGDDTLYGAGGSDTFYGGAGADTFLFKAVTALSSSVTIGDFSTSDGDKINLTDVLDGHYDPVHDAITNFITLTTSGSDTLLKVDLDGTGGTYSPTTIATISGVTGLDVTTMIADHHLLIPT